MEEINGAQMKYIAVLQDLIAKQEMEIKELKEKLTEASSPTSSETKHGHWVRKNIRAGYYWECSVCHANPGICVTKNTNYCPYCGSRNDEDEK